MLSVISQCNKLSGTFNAFISGTIPGFALPLPETWLIQCMRIRLPFSTNNQYIGIWLCQCWVSDAIV